MFISGAERALRKIRINASGEVCTAGGLIGRRECELRQTIRHRRGAVQTAADAALLQSVNGEYFYFNAPLPPHLSF